MVDRSWRDRKGHKIFRLVITAFTEAFYGRTEEQRRMLKIEQHYAYTRWVLEGELMHKDGLQGKRGYAAAKRQHLKELKERKK